MTKDRVSPKETLKLLEIYALQKFYESNPSYFNKNQKTNNSLVLSRNDNIISIEGVEIADRPHLTVQNYQKLPLYQEWQKLIETEPSTDSTLFSSQYKLENSKLRNIERSNSK